MCKTFIPLMAPNGRIVNLSSVASTLKPYSEQIRQRFRQQNLTFEDLEQLAQEFQVVQVHLAVIKVWITNPTVAIREIEDRG